MLGERGTHLRSSTLSRFALVAIAVALTSAAAASSANAAMIGNVRVVRTIMPRESKQIPRKPTSRSRESGWSI
jgi:hypothetical protein